MYRASHQRHGEPEAFTVLSVSLLPEDHSTLEHIFGDCVPDSNTNAHWQLSRASTLACALGVLRRLPCRVVMCERDLPPGNWKDLLEYTQCLDNPPSLIVTSRHADDCLWAEALNLGAYDVLAKPFDRTEIIRVVGFACQRWHRDENLAAGTARARQTANSR